MQATAIVPMPSRMNTRPTVTPTATTLTHGSIMQTTPNTSSTMPRARIQPQPRIPSALRSKALTNLETPENTIARGVYENTIENRLPEAVKKLDDRSRRIIEARWLYNDQDGSKGATLADLAKEMGVSQERVRQLEKKAFATLKTYLKEDKDV